MAFSIIRALSIAGALAAAAPVMASPRDTLLVAAFGPSDKARALELVRGARAEAAAQVARNPADGEAALQLAMATGYDAKLARGATDAKSARRQFETLVARHPRDPEPLLALAGWHLETVHTLGGFLAGTALGARKSLGLAALDRAVALGGPRPLATGFAALLRIMTDPADVATARRYAEAAAAAPATTPADRIIKTAAQRLLVPLRAGNGKAASALAEKLMPFGRFAS